MTPSELAQALLGRYAATHPAAMKAYDGKASGTTTNAYAVLSLGAVVPGDRKLSADFQKRVPFRWMVVNNSAAGVRLNAEMLINAFHKYRIDGRLVTYDFASDPIYDDRVEGSLRWSITADFLYHPKG